MTIRYAYNRQVTPPAPFVHVAVSPPIEGSSTLIVPAQIDTGADLSVIPGRLVDELHLVPLDLVSAQSFGGQLLTLPTYLVELRIRDLEPVSVKVFARPEEYYALLGRDVLNRLTILLDGPNLVVEIR